MSILREREEEKKRIQFLQKQRENEYLRKISIWKRYFIVSLICLVVFVALGTVLWFNVKGAVKTKIVERKVFVKAPKNEPDLMYAIQICAFEEVDVEFDSIIKHYINIDTGLNEYLLGSFDSYEKAKIFVEKLDLLGFKDAYITAFYRGEKIEVRDAINMQLNDQNNNL